MYGRNEGHLNRRQEYLRRGLPHRCDVSVGQPWNSKFRQVVRSSSILLVALLCLPAVLRAQSLAVDPDALDLGVVGVGVEKRASVSIENLQDDALEVIVGISGDGFKALSDTLRLDGRGVGSVDVSFTADAAGEYSGELTIHVAAWFNDRRVVVPLQAAAVVPPLELLPAGGLDFGAVPVGRVAMAVVVVRNTGTATLPAGQMEVADLKGPFSIEGDVGPWPATGGETGVNVVFAPTGAGPVATEFIVTAPDFGDWSIPLRGSGLAPEAAFSPLPQVGLDFGAVDVSKRLTRHVSVLNQGRAGLHVENVAIEGAEFTLGAGDSSAIIAPGGRLDLSVAFVPQYEGARTGILRLYTNDPHVADVAIPLAGRGRVRPPRIEIINGDIDFGSVPIGGTARSHLLLWNRGGQPGVAEVSVVAEEGAEFDIAQHSVVLLPGASAQVALSFSPRESGTRQAVLNVAAEAKRQTVRLQGVGRFFALSPATVDFGRVAVGESSSRVVEIANVGNADFEIHQLRSTSAEFNVHTSIDADSRFLLPANSQRTLPLDVTFSPSARGAISGTLRLDGLGANKTMALDVLLKGHGVAAEIELNPAGVVDFGYAVLGEQSERTFVATNVGDTVLQVEAHPQSKEAHVAPAKFALDAGESASLTLCFTPHALGERRGRVFLVSNDVKDRARPLEYKGNGVLADVDLAQIVEVLVTRGEKTQPLAVGWNNVPVMQRDGTKVDVSIAIPDSLRQALIGREIVVEWTRLDENYATKGRSSNRKQKVKIYESSGRRVMTQDLDLQLSEEDNRRVRLKITTRSYPGAAPQSVSQILEAGGWKWEFEAKPLFSFLTIRPGRDYTDADGNAVQGKTERLLGLPGLAFAGWHNVDNPSISGIHLTVIGNVLEALSTERSLAISLGVAVSFYRDQFLLGFGWDIYDNRPLARKQGSQDYIMTLKYSGLFR
ncbi:MAG: choice-of-anchor D domain-containing protein [Gemmatimonadota bacterium]|nr:choice-of-anchor D domain-containing protein [Gemmatimonadota bacterium]